jgi:Cobyric acid synthase
MHKNIMILGTASSAGKSLITTALCRIFYEDGFKVTPFKSQNMSLNSFVTKNGLEMGRAQVVQAEACGMEPEVFMNPILLKPNSDNGSQVIVMGKALQNMKASDYFEYRKVLRGKIKEIYGNIKENFDISVIEGAGSPAEINLNKDDIVNIGMDKNRQKLLVF